jgi:hypothetical protein
MSPDYECLCLLANEFLAADYHYHQILESFPHTLTQTRVQPDLRVV